MTLCDSHAHFGSYLKDIEYMFTDRSLYLIINTTNANDFIPSLEYVKNYSANVFLFAGVHPNESEVNASWLADLIPQNLRWISGIGEIGLDSSTHSAEQSAEFEKQLQLAEQLKIPVAVHSRGLVGDVLGELSRYRLKNVLLHWFDSTEGDLGKAVSRGYFVSFGPVVAYSKRMSRLASLVPVDLLLAETDSPVRYGSFFGGKPSDPRLLCSVIFALARIRHVRAEELEESIFVNFQRFLGVNLR